MGSANPGDTFLGVKAILINWPDPFEGKPDDLERFFGDCITYFKVDWDGQARYRYPDWMTFMKEVVTQFCDPAIEEVHKRKMYELKMMGKAATVYFQELEMEARLANRRNDDEPRLPWQRQHPKLGESLGN
ncbi:hypothetical protein ARMGADRAFT_1087772 [Armillaria gallica]|uniref:Retrotransposon gag domain-containing protein n=1 Tax=Armillaria gallica TaxID=47427 RepID=A0A2H3CUI3_ARMGA|nr:hypothetical protein ARMGADRAFT_1087772 [Armillaria gallica]